MNKLYGLLVGSNFRPPAKCILSSLASATPLELRPEPENPYDEEAVAVYLRTDLDIPSSSYDSLREELPNFGSSLDELLSSKEPLHLGYLAREGNRDISRRSDASPTGEISTAGQVLSLIEIDRISAVTLLWGPNGESLIKIEIPQIEEEE